MLLLDPSDLLLQRRQLFLWVLLVHFRPDLSGPLRQRRQLFLWALWDQHLRPSVQRHLLGLQNR